MAELEGAGGVVAEGGLNDSDYYDDYIDEEEEDDEVVIEDPKEIERKQKLARRKSSHLLQRFEDDNGDAEWMNENIGDDKDEAPAWMLGRAKLPAAGRVGQLARTESSKGVAPPIAKPQRDIREVRKESRRKRTPPSYAEGLGGITMSTTVKTFLPRITQSDSTLTRLDLCWRNLPKKEIKSLLSALQKNRTLKEIDLTGNELKKSGGSSVGKLLKNTKILESLVLRSTDLGRSGTKSVCSGLAVNTTLKNLDISWNGFGCSGMEYLEKAMSKNKTLQSLDLQSNELKRKGADPLAKMFLSNNTLTNVDISNNDLTNPGAKEVFLALKKNNTILYLNISYNDKGLPIAKPGIKAINDVLARNREKKGLPDAKEIIMLTPMMCKRKAIESKETGMSSLPSSGSAIVLSSTPDPGSPNTRPVLSKTDSFIGQRGSLGLGLPSSMSDFHIQFGDKAILLGKVKREVPISNIKNEKAPEGTTWSPLAKLQSQNQVV